MTASNSGSEQHNFKFFGFIVALYVAMQLISDVTAGKVTEIVGFPVSVTVLWFPFTYIFADVLTEVYGYGRARHALWTVLLCSILAGVFYQVAAFLPPASGFEGDEAYKRVFYQVPRILVGGWMAVLAGEICNNYILARLKIITQGRHLWMRIIGSTIVGQLVNTSIFYVVALYGVLPNNVLMEAILAGWLIKTAVEVLFTPVTYLVIGVLKRAENVDYIDKNTNFNPFIFRLKT